MSNQRLVIRMGRDAFSFSTTAEGEVKYERYAINSGISIAANMREALRTVMLLQENYRRVVVLADTPVLTIPTTIFQEEDMEEMYRYTYVVKEQHVVMHAILPELNAVAVFALPRDLRQVLMDRYSQVTYLPIMAPVWQHMHRKSYTGQRTKLYAYLYDRRLELFSFQQNRFRFQNSYPVNDAEDCLFFILSVWKSLVMEPQEDELHIAGQTTDKEALKERVTEFIKRVYVVNPSGEFNRAQVTQINDMPYDLMLYYLKGV